VVQNTSEVGMSGSLDAKVEDMGVVAEQTENRAGNPQEPECSVGCFSTSSRTASREVLRQQSVETPKSGRHCCEAADLSKWKCPDPGCKTNNQEGQGNCSNCRLPRHSANQFKRSQSKILKQL